MAVVTVLVVVVSGVVYHTCRTAQCDAACTRVEVDAIQVGWRPQSIEGCGWSDVALVRVSASVWCVVCGVVSRTRCRKGKKKRVLSYHFGVAACNVIWQNLEGADAKIPKVWRSFPWADSGREDPSL